MCCAHWHLTDYNGVTGNGQVRIQPSTNIGVKLYASAPAENGGRESFRSYLAVLKYTEAGNPKGSGTEAALHELWFRYALQVLRMTSTHTRSYYRSIVTAAQGMHFRG